MTKPSAKTTATAPYVWDAQACQLIDQHASEILASIGTAGGPAADADVPAVYAAKLPRYTPYRSGMMPCHETGYRLAQCVLNASYAPEMQDSILASPIGGAVRAIVATQATFRLGDSPAVQALTALGAIAPRKGGEAPWLLAEYRRRKFGVEHPCQVMRDFWTSTYTWMWIRGSDMAVRGLSASLMTITTAVDYVDATDDANAGDQNGYLLAASEGFGLLGGAGAELAARETALFGAVTLVKDSLTRNAAETPFPVEAGVDPAQFRMVRWWDGAIAPYFRLITGSTDYRHLSDDRGFFLAAASCPRIQRVLDNIYRYNELQDAVADFTNWEPINEVLAALIGGGAEAVAGYGDAIAESTDHVLECNCGIAGHEVAAELAMGSCLWYLVAPRSPGRYQLAAFVRSQSSIATAYAPTRLVGYGCHLDPGGLLHQPDWHPSWSPVRRPIEQIAFRLARRCLHRPELSVRTARAAAETLSTVVRADSTATLGHLERGWEAVFDAALTDAGVPGEAPQLRDLVTRMWSEVLLGRGSDRALAAKLFIDLDIAILDTYRLPDAEAYLIRRAFFGLTSGMVELSGLNPYSRLADGLAELASPSTSRRHHRMPLPGASRVTQNPL